MPTSLDPAVIEAKEAQEALDYAMSKFMDWFGRHQLGADRTNKELLRRMERAEQLGFRMQKILKGEA